MNPDVSADVPFIENVSSLEAEVRLLSGDVVRGSVTSLQPGHLIMEISGVTKVNVPYSAVCRIGAA